jgi:hypothetical protein
VAKWYNKAMVDLGNADNISDANKPVSRLHKTALNLKANLVSPSIKYLAHFQPLYQQADVNSIKLKMIQGTDVITLDKMEFKASRFQLVDSQFF